MFHWVRNEFDLDIISCGLRQRMERTDSIVLSRDSPSDSLMWPVFPSYIERYFEQYEYNVNQYVHINKNNLVLTGLLQNHPVLTPNNSIISITFVDSKGADLLTSINEVSGKRKRGGLYVQTGDQIALVSTTDGDFPVFSGVPGKLLEANTKLLDSPELLRDLNLGWLVMVMPNAKKMTSIRTALSNK